MDIPHRKRVGAAGKTGMERSREGLERMKGLRKVRNGRPEVERATDAKRAETAGSRTGNGCEASRNCRKATGQRMRSEQKRSEST